MHTCIIELSGCDVTWCMGVGAPEGYKQLAASGLSCRKPLVGTG